MNDPNWHRSSENAAVPDEMDRCICMHRYVDHDEDQCLEPECECQGFEYWEQDPDDSTFDNGYDGGER